MLTRYIETAMHNATYSIQEDGSYLGEILPLPDVWSHADTLEACRLSLQEILEEWIILALNSHQSIPDIDGANLAIDSDNTLTEADLADIRAAREDIKHNGTVSWDAKAEIGRR
ncbi:MAG: type II toxin-antitoxin system HicB family antitoxin [Lyngbya sp. HA4199-MV5]|jgi:predicted RNase H-like HicB family nuclease|nr:type II toxin-antitoxin system HicB family antitoxin [Lyngbya sp. HA4199-MV5]